MQFRVLAATVAALGLASAAHASTNLVTNGDFEAGNTGFGSDYTYVSGFNSATPPAVYAVDTNPNFVHTSWAAFGDHTSGDGKMMIINGSEDEGQLVWFQNNIAVEQNTTYFFSTWIHTTYDEAPAALDFSININAIGMTFNAGSIADGWQQFYASWNSGSNTVANIALVNQQLAFSGNDFALDDISLSTASPGGVPEPASWALMIMGFGSAGAMLRRRRTALLRA